MTADCKMHDHIDATECPHYQKNGDVHCFTVRVCQQVSELCVTLGAKMGKMIVMRGMMAAAQDAAIVAMHQELEREVANTTGCMLTVIAGGPDKMVWLLASAVIDLLGTKAANEFLPSCFKMGNELGALICAHIATLDEKEKPEHLTTHTLHGDKVSLN